MPDEPLDTPQSCFHELISINMEVARYGVDWANTAGELRGKLKREERLRRDALRQLKGQGMTVQEKDAQAAFMVSEKEPELYERIEELEEKVEDYRIRFRTHDRRASNAQSILAAIRKQEGIEDYVYFDQ